MVSALGQVILKNPVPTLNAVLAALGRPGGGGNPAGCGGYRCSMGHVMGGAGVVARCSPGIAAAVSGPGPSRGGVPRRWYRMFTWSPAGLPAGPVLDHVLLPFISLAQCCWEPSTFSWLLNSPVGSQCPEGRRGWARGGWFSEGWGLRWHTFSLEAGVEG